VFSVFLLHNSDNDRMLKTVLWTASVAVDYVWTLFQRYAKLLISLSISVCQSVCCSALGVINVFINAKFRVDRSNHCEDIVIFSK